MPKPHQEEELRRKVLKLCEDHRVSEGLNLTGTKFEDELLALFTFHTQQLEQRVMEVMKDEPYVPGNPLLGRLAPRKKESVDSDNELRAELRTKLTQVFHPTKPTKPAEQRWREAL
jgi:hypothetical protein